MKESVFFLFPENLFCKRLKPPVFKKGVSLIVFLLAIFVLSILLTGVYYVRNQHSKVLNDSANEYQAFNVAEAGVHTILSELRYNDNYALQTLAIKNPSSGGLSWDWAWGEGGEWLPLKPEDYDHHVGDIPQEFSLSIKKPKEKRWFLQGEFNDPYINGYFKVKFSNFDANTKMGNSPKIKTLWENELYGRVESVAHIRDTKTFVRINSILEKRVPILENVLYDGEVLDVPHASNRGGTQQFKNSRMYGHKFIHLTNFDAQDNGYEFKDFEKLETNGWLQVKKGEKYRFGTINPKPSNEGKNFIAKGSANLEEFDAFDEMLLDRDHGGRSHFIPELSRDYFFNVIKRKVILVKSGANHSAGKLLVPESKWKNPEKPNEVVYDLNFGLFHDGGNGDDPVWGTGKFDGDSDLGVSPPQKDDYKFPNYKNLVVVTDLPIRIWGAPDQSTTIYSSKDIYISGDFNQKDYFIGSPVNLQIYPRASSETSQRFFGDYAGNRSDKPMGVGKYRFGCALLSGERVWFNYSEPALFLRNEFIPFIEFLMGSFLAGENDKPDAVDYFNFGKSTEDLEKRRAAILAIACKLDSVWNKSHGNFWSAADFPLIARVLEAPFPDPNSVQNPEAYAKWLLINTEIRKKVFAFCKDRLGIDDGGDKMKIFLGIWGGIRSTYPIPGPKGLPGKFRISNLKILPGITEIVWNQWDKMTKEAETSEASPLHQFAPALFNAAGLSQSDMLFSPEMTINANVVSSARRFQKYIWGNSQNKIYEEIGNVDSSAGKIWKFLAPENKQFLILRIFGSYIRLANKTPDLFYEGKSYNKEGTLRRVVYANPGQDSTGEGAPPRLPHSWNILSYEQEKISQEEFDNFE